MEIAWSDSNDNYNILLRFFTNLIILVTIAHLLMQTKKSGAKDERDKVSFSLFFFFFLVFLQTGTARSPGNCRSSLGSREAHTFFACLKFSLQPIFIALIHFFTFCSHCEKTFIHSLIHSYSIIRCYPLIKSWKFKLEYILKPSSLGTGCSTAEQTLRNQWVRIIPCTYFIFSSDFPSHSYSWWCIGSQHWISSL